MKFRAKIIVKLKEKVKDAKGEAVNAVLKRISLEEEGSVRMGKFFELEITSDSFDEANIKLHKIIDDVLVNPVVETFDIIEFEPADKLVSADSFRGEEKCQN